MNCTNPTTTTTTKTDSTDIIPTPNLIGSQSDIAHKRTPTDDDDDDNGHHTQSSPPLSGLNHIVSGAQTILFQRCSIKHVLRTNRKLSTKVDLRNSNSLGQLDSRISNNEPNNNITNINNSCNSSYRLVNSISRSTSVPIGIGNEIVRQPELVKVEIAQEVHPSSLGGGCELDTLVLLGKAASDEKDALVTENCTVHGDVNNAKSTCNGDKPDVFSTPLGVRSSASTEFVSRQMPEVQLASSVSGFSLKSKCTNPFLVDDDNDDDGQDALDEVRRTEEGLRVKRSEFTEMESTENDCERSKRRFVRRRKTTTDDEMQPMLLAACNPNGLATNGECDKSLLLLNEMEEPISMPVFLGASLSSNSNVDRDDNNKVEDDDCTSMSVDFLNTNYDLMTNANHKSCTSLLQTTHWPHNDLGRASGRNGAKGGKFRTASNYGQIQSQRTSSSENVQTMQSQSLANDFNRPRRVPKYPDRLMNGDFDLQTSYVRRIVETPKTINGIPTLPFQRQDYSRPEEHSDESCENPRGVVSSLASSKPLRKEILNFVAREKSIMPNVKKLNIAYPNKTQTRPNVSTDGEEKLNDKSTFKKSLLKIGHKCGLRISRSPEKKKTEKLSNGSNHNIIGLNAQLTGYSGHQSTVDLSQNLPNLDSFFEENFDRIEDTKGTQSIGKATNRKRRHGHKRTKSCSKNMGTSQLLEFSNVNLDSSDSGGHIMFQEQDRSHRNMFVLQTEEENVRQPSDFNRSNVSRQNHGVNLRYQKTPSSSDSFGTYNSKKSQTVGSSREVPCFGAAEPILLNSNTTSSSLSSSDYASVYSPSSSFTTEQPFVDVYPQHHPPKPIEISPKHRRIKTRNQHDSTHFANSTDSHNPFAERSCFQFENQLPYHEDYLSHYHNQMIKNAVMASSLPADYPTSSSSNGSYYHLTERRPSFTGVRGNTIIDSRPVMPPSISSHSSHSTQSYASSAAAHRVIMTQSKKLPGEVVLEYEC